MSSVVISGDTSGTCTLQAPAVAGSTVLTLPANTGTIMVNGPAFSAYASAAQTVTLNFYTKVAINSAIFDTNSNYNTSLYRFTPTIAGYYQVNGLVRGNAVTSFTSLFSSLYKNGVIYSSGGWTQTSTSLSGANHVQLSDLVYMNGSSDYIELWGLVDGTGTATFQNAASASITSRFSAFLARGA